MTLRTLNYGNYGIFLIMGNAGFCPSTVPLPMILMGCIHATGCKGSGIWGSFGRLLSDLKLGDPNIVP